MDNILIDITDFKSDLDIDKKLYNKAYIVSSIKYKNLRIDYIKINSKYINEIKENVNKKSNIFLLTLKKIRNIEYKYKIKSLEKILKNYENQTAILSNNIYNKPYYIEYISEILSNCNLKELKLENTMNNNSIKIVEKYISEEVIDINKLKILWMINDLESIDITKLLEYIEKFKYLDILSKHTNKMMLTKISNINKEYGTAINVIKKRNIVEYNIYINFDMSDIDKNEYIYNSNKKILNIQNSDEDIFNPLYISYIKNIENIRIIDKNLINKFSKLNLGYLSSYIIE